MIKLDLYFSELEKGMEETGKIDWLEGCFINLGERR